MQLRIGKQPKSTAEIAKANRKLDFNNLVNEIRRLHLAKKITPVFDTQAGVKVCLWKRI